MCLYSENKEPFVAEQDITCYKVLSKIGSAYLTPYLGVEVTIPGTLHASSPDYPISVGYIYEGENRYVIGGQAVHAYRFLRTAKNNAIASQGFVARCTIPKGAKYWIASCFDQIASDILQINEILTFNPHEL